MKQVCNLLIADDHRIMTDGLKSMLADTEFVVTAEAADGREALEKIASAHIPIDIVLTDISMPLLSGIELCREIKSKHRGIKVLVLSMYSSPSAVKEAIKAEADGFIVKSGGRDELLKALHSIRMEGTYFGMEILPVLYNQFQKEKKQFEETVQLTPREKEILKLIVKEYNSDEIAEELSISKRTVDTHRHNMLSKFDCKSTIGLVKFAIKSGLAEV